MRQASRQCVIYIAVFSAVLLHLPSQSALAAEAPPADAVVLRPQMLFDPVFGKNAYSVLTPEKWKMQGEVLRTPGLPTPEFDISVADPVQHTAWREFPRILFVDGVREHQISQFPNQRAWIERQWAEGTITPMGLEVRKQPASPREYVQKVLVPRFVPEVANATDVNVVSEVDLPDFAKAHTDNDPFHRPARSSRFRITYTTPTGPVEREFVSTLIFDTDTDKAPRQQSGARPAPPPTGIWIAEVTTCRAPKGRLDAMMPLFATIESSLKVQLPWYNTECQVAEMYLKQQREIEAEILGDQAGAIAKRAKIFHEMAQKASDQVSEHIRDNFANQQKAKAENQEQFMHYINGTASFTDPNDGSKLTLSNSYKYQYISNQGDIFQTDEPTLNPPVDPKTSWRQLEKSSR